MSWRFVPQGAQDFLVENFPRAHDPSAGSSLPDRVGDAIVGTFPWVGTRRLGQLANANTVVGGLGVTAVTALGPLSPNLSGRIAVPVAFRAMHDDPVSRSMEMRLLDPALGSDFPIREFFTAGGNRWYGGPINFYLAKNWSIRVALDAIAAVNRITTLVYYYTLPIGEELVLPGPFHPGVETST